MQILLVPNKRVFRIPVNYINLGGVALARFSVCGSLSQPVIEKSEQSVGDLICSSLDLPVSPLETPISPVTRNIVS